MKVTSFCLTLSVMLATLILSPSLASSQSSGSGGDMFTGWMESMDLFRPHPDSCDSSTEAFVTVDPLGRGLCIEKNERTAQQFEDARITCVDLGKRLPEPSEFQFACDAAGSLGLSNMTDDLEWASNFSQAIYFGSNGGHVAAAGGNGSCGWLGWGVLGQSVSSSRDSLPFRCVR